MLRVAGYVPEKTQWPVTDEPLELKGAHDRRIWLLTIRHTGTHYMFRHLERLGFFQGRPNIKQKVLINHRYAPYFLHSHIEATPILQFVCDDPVVMTMRNPAAVYLSHLNRYPWHEGFHLSYVEYAYRLFEKVRERYNPFIFKVDAPDQSAEVRSLAGWLGIESKFRDVAKDLNHDGRVRPVNQEVPKEILELAENYGY